MNRRQRQVEHDKRDSIEFWVLLLVLVGLGAIVVLKVLPGL